MNIIFFGLGGVGQRHLRIIKKIRPSSKIYSYRTSDFKFEIDDSLNKNAKVNIIEKYSITIIEDKKKLDSVNIDLAIICNPTSLHIKYCLEMAKRKIPFFVEKPLSNNNKNILKLLNIVKKNSLKFYVGYMLRFHPQSIKLYNLIKHKKTLGTIYNITINVNSYMPNWHKYESYKKLYASNFDLGGGAILTECHEIDLMNFFFSKPKIIFDYGKKLSNLSLNVEDNALCLLKYSYNKNSFLCSLQTSFAQKTNYRNIVIFSDKYLIKWDINNSDLRIFNNINGKIDHDILTNFDRNIMFENQMKFIFNDLNLNRKNKKDFYSIFYDTNLITHNLITSLSKNANSSSRKI